MANIRFKPVLRYDPSWPKLRLFRVAWEHGSVGDGNGYSRKISVALRPRLWSYGRGWDSLRVCILGVELHTKRNYGGIWG